MEPALLFLPYLPPIAWVQQLIEHHPVWLEREENFPKSTYRNRCEIATANGRKTLSIPLVGGRDHHQLYKDVQISYYTDWLRIHWNSIRSAYGSSPFFEHYAGRFQNFYEKRPLYLFDFNLELLNMLLELLDMRQITSPQFTASYQVELTGMHDLRDSKLITASSSKEPHYYQVFADRHGFMPNLSIIDLIFNTGPMAGEWVREVY